jgi:hypothetical protein
LPTKVFGIEFPNPVGLAAGLDKNGAYIDALAALGDFEKSYLSRFRIPDLLAVGVGGAVPP